MPSCGSGAGAETRMPCESSASSYSVPSTSLSHQNHNHTLMTTPQSVSYRASRLFRNHTLQSGTESGRPCSACP